MHIETPRCQFDLNETRLFFLPPDCRHMFYGKSHNRFLVLDVPGQVLSTADTSRLSGGVSLTVDERWLALRSLL